MTKREYTNARGHAVVVNDVERNAHLGELWMRIGRESVERERRWIDELRMDGVKAAHPDDGWVERDLNYVFLSYPQFDDGLAVGERLALGYPSSGDDLMADTRIVRIVGYEDRALKLTKGGMRWWAFDDIPLRTGRDR